MLLFPFPSLLGLSGSFLALGNVGIVFVFWDSEKFELCLL